MSRETPICPKCGYDQSGFISTWESRCPLEGRCPECGLDFAWADVMDPSRVSLAWYSEHAFRIWAMVSRTIPTLMKLLWPPRFWAKVGILTTVRLRVLALWVCFVSLLMHLIASIPMGIGLYHEVDSFRYASFMDLVNSGGMKAVLQTVINGLGWPFVHCQYTPGGGFDWYVFIWRHGYGGGSVAWASFFFGAVALWSIVLLLVPVTRRIAKIRKAHVGRAMILGLLPMVAGFELARISEGLVYWNQQWGMWVVGIFIPLLLLTGLWHLVFWTSAIRRGWGVRPSWILIILGTIASVLGGVVSVYILGVNT